MKFKTTFSLVCFTWMMLLSVGRLNVHANSACADYYGAYQSAVDAHNLAREAYHRVQLAVSKKIPPFIANPELQHLENEYDSDPTGFYKAIEGMGVSMPAWASGLLSLG